MFNRRLILLLLPLILIGCSGSTEDVRITLCKDLTMGIGLQTDKQPEWISEDMKFDGYEDMQVILKYTVAGKTLLSRCDYPYEAIDEDALTLSNPASAYATYPSKVIINGEAVASAVLAEKVRLYLKKQGIKLVEPAVKAVKEATTQSIAL